MRSVKPRLLLDGQPTGIHDWGDVSLAAALDRASQRFASLWVRAPEILVVRTTHQDLPCNDLVPVTLEFTNGGDGVARSVEVVVSILDLDDQAHDSKTLSAGDVPASATGPSTRTCGPTTGADRTPSTGSRTP